MMRPAAIALPVLLVTACGPDASQAPRDAMPAPTSSQQVAPPSELAAPHNTPADSKVSASDTLTAEGLGPLTIGMSLEQVEQTAGPDANPDSVGGPEPLVCDQFHPEDTPKGVFVMIEDGVLTRISLIRDANIKTDAGLTLGAPSDDVRAAYTEVEVTPHKYQEAPAAYIDAWANVDSSDDAIDNPQARGIRYVVGLEGVVETIHAGGPSIRYVEGCL